MHHQRDAHAFAPELPEKTKLIAVPTVLTAVNRIRMKPQQGGRTLANS
jgi:hypothetical protein